MLHIDISDACNIIMYVGESQDVLINYSDEPPANSGTFPAASFVYFFGSSSALLQSALEHPF